MPRANRCLIPGQVWHITHRCHDRSFLFRFAKERELWLHWLRQWLRRWLSSEAALDQLVQFATIESDAATFRAVVDLDSLTLAHQEIGVGADGAFHPRKSSSPQRAQSSQRKNKLLADSRLSPVGWAAK